MAAATSSAGTRRPVGWRAASWAFSAAGSGALASSRATHGVSTVTGATQLTRTPAETRSAAIARVRPWTAPFEAEYRARWTRPARAQIDDMLTIAACDERRR